MRIELKKEEQATGSGSFLSGTRYGGDRLRERAPSRGETGSSCLVKVRASLQGRM